MMFEQEQKLKEEARACAEKTRVWNDEYLKAQAEQQCCDGNATTAPQAGQIGPDYDKGCDNASAKPHHTGLRARVGQRFRGAQHQARNADHLAELLFLLDQHPDVARILDLLELTGA